MAKLIYGLNTSIDGFIDHERLGPPDSVLFRHFIERVRISAGSLYGRKMYEIMAYWDADNPDWDDAEREYAAVWQAQPKWVASRTLAAVGPNATLLGPDLEAEVRRLKTDIDGDIEVCGPHLAAGLTDLRLIDAYELYIHPVVLGAGTPFFAKAPPPLRLTASDRIGESAVRLTYVPVS